MLFITATSLFAACGPRLDHKYPRPDYSQPREVLAPQRTVEVESLSAAGPAYPKQFVIEAPGTAGPGLEYPVRIEPDDDDSSGTLILTIQRGRRRTALWRKLPSFNSPGIRPATGNTAST